jgi:hypothetical protein
MMTFAPPWVSPAFTSSKELLAEPTSAAIVTMRPAPSFYGILGFRTMVFKQKPLDEQTRQRAAENAREGNQCDSDRTNGLFCLACKLWRGFGCCAFQRFLCWLSFIWCLGLVRRQ